MLSRFRNRREQAAILETLREGVDGLRVKIVPRVPSTRQARAE